LIVIFWPPQHWLHQRSSGHVTNS